ncbi:MAG: HAD-IB family phosphatase [Ruminococcus sp.]
MNAYDFDKTIYKNDSTADFYFYCLKRHPKILKFFPRLLGGFIKYYIFRKGTKTEFKSKMASFVRVIDAPKEAEKFWALNKHKIKAFYLENQKPDDVIISASPEFLLSPICKELGIKHLICSKVDPSTGRFLAENCHGEEKVRRFAKLYNTETVDEFYSDSYSDTPMAELAKKAYLVKGEKLTDWKFK